MIVQNQKIEETSKPRERLSWSCRLKHPDIDITGNVIRRREMTNGGYSVCILINQPLGKTRSDIRWNLRILKRQGAAFIGVCLKRYIEKDNFSYEGLGSRGHGHYVFESDANIFQHDGKRIDRDQQRFRINTNDEIELFYSKVQNSLQVSKNRAKLFTMEISPVDQSYQLYPIVYLGRSDDAVQLLQ